MKKACFIFVISLIIFSSCSGDKAVRDEIALVVGTPKEEARKPETKQAAVLPDKPSRQDREEEVIPPEVDIMKPSGKEVTALPGKPSVKVKDLPPEKIKELAGKLGITVKELVEGEIEIDEFGRIIRKAEKPEIIFWEPFKEKIVLFPFKNLTSNRNALKHVIPELITKLRYNGYKVVEEDRLYEFICKKRVRHNGYVSKKLARQIKDEFEVNYILTGSITLFSPGKRPRLGLLARLIDSSNGTIVWASYSSITGDEFAGLLELGRISDMRELISRGVDTLLASFRTEQLQKEEPGYRIAVLPFLNKSKHKNAGIIATNLFLVDLLKSNKFVPIEYGNVKELIIDLRIRNTGEMGFDNLKVFSETLDAEGILIGTVETYTNSYPPTVAINTRLLDGNKNKILWYNNLRLNGEESIIVFDWGKINTADKVAYRVVSELVEKMETEKWH